MTTSARNAPFANLVEAYERVAVPAMFVREALGLLAAISLRPGERVLDLACGTGIVTRLAAPRLDSSGSIVALDLNPAMLAAALAQPSSPGAPVRWLRGNALALPFRSATFDVVLCQNGLQFMPDRTAALKEMRRVLVPEGRLGLIVVACEAASLAVERSVAKFLSPADVAYFHTPVSLGDADALADLLAGADFRDVSISRQSLTACCPAVDDFIAFTLSTRLAEILQQLNAEDYAALHADARAQLEPFAGAQGLEFPVEMLVVVARP